MFVLRTASDADRDWLRGLYHATMRNTVEQMWGWNDAWQDAYFDQHFDPGRLRIVQVDGSDIGMIEVERRPAELFLANIQVTPGWQGRGVGTSLIRNLVSAADGQGLPVSLRVIKGNPASRLYERLGFTFDGETATHYLMRHAVHEPRGGHA